MSENRLDVPWVREWLGRALILVADQLYVVRVQANRAIPIEIVFDHDDGFPVPSYLEALKFLDGGDLFEEWKDFEPPPNPLAEKWEEFLERIKKSWQLRVNAVGGALATKRKPTQHAEWTARFHVGGESANDVWATAEVKDRRSVPKQIEAFAALIELPLREKPSTKTEFGNI